MTYADLLEAMKHFSPEQLKQTVTIYVQGGDEFYPVVQDFPLVESDETCDVLDAGHKYLVI